jgi:hypothetical protein
MTFLRFSLRQKKGNDGDRVLLVYGGQKTLKRIDLQDFQEKKGNKLKNE